MGKHNEAERIADAKLARHEAQRQRESEARMKLTPEEIRQFAIIHRNLAERRRQWRMKRELQYVRDVAPQFNCLGDAFAAATIGDYA